MPINQSQQGLRTASGWPPDDDPDLARALVDAWSEAYLAERAEPPAMAEGYLLRASDAGACARALSYRIRRRRDPQEPGPSNPPTIADNYRFSIGHLVHDQLAEHLATAFGDGAEVEVVTVRDADPPISMHVDAIVTEQRDQLRHSSDGDAIAADVPYKTVVEIKTINGMGFKDTVGLARKDKPARGPRWNAVIQGALAAHEHQADRLVILVFALELIGKSIAERNHLAPLGQMVAQFSLTPEEFIPIAEKEQQRMAAVLKIVQDDRLAPRSIPDPELVHGNRITNPATGLWVAHDSDGRLTGTGNTWHCDYCDDRSRCIADGET